MANQTSRGSRERLPIWRDAQRLLFDVEEAVRSFSRYHKYTLDTDLRRQAMDLCRLLARAVAVREAERAGTITGLSTGPITPPVVAHQCYGLFQPGAFFFANASLMRG